MLTRFEIARVVGVRVLQLSRGAPPLIRVKKGMEAPEIAKEEMRKGVLPFSIIREYPNGKVEYYNIKGEKIGEAEKH